MDKPLSRQKMPIKTDKARSYTRLWLWVIGGACALAAVIAYDVFLAMPALEKAPPAPNISITDTPKKATLGDGGSNGDATANIRGSSSFVGKSSVVPESSNPDMGAMPPSPGQSRAATTTPATTTPDVTRPVLSSPMEHQRDRTASLDRVKDTHPIPDSSAPGASRQFLASTTAMALIGIEQAVHSGHGYQVAWKWLAAHYPNDDSIVFLGRHADGSIPSYARLEKMLREVVHHRKDDAAAAQAAAQSDQASASDQVAAQPSASDSAAAQSDQPSASDSAAAQSDQPSASDNDGRAGAGAGPGPRPHRWWDSILRIERIDRDRSAASPASSPATPPAKPPVNPTAKPPVSPLMPWINQATAHLQQGRLTAAMVAVETAKSRFSIHALDDWLAMARLRQRGDDALRILMDRIVHSIGTDHCVFENGGVGVGPCGDAMPPDLSKGG